MKKIGQIEKGTILTDGSIYCEVLGYDACRNELEVQDYEYDDDGNGELTGATWNMTVGDFQRFEIMK